MSQHSTTTTETHTLIKYSRSYGLGTDNNDWQHFINPVIKIFLDKKTSLKGELTSVRLRILWLMNTGNDSMDMDKTEVTFENVDLLSFSSLSDTQQICNSQGLPLKAVYRDSVVGIRYLHPLSTQPNSSPIYRRFQITFQSNSAASQFIDAIRHICPCKLHEPFALGRTGTTVPSSTQLHDPHGRQPTTQKHVPACVSSMAHTSNFLASSQHATVQPPSKFVVAQSSPLETAPSSGLSISSFHNPNNSTPLNMSSSPSAATLPNFHDNGSHKSAPAPIPAQTGAIPTINPEKRTRMTNLGHPGSSLPASSEPSSNSDSSLMLPPPPPSRDLQSVENTSASETSPVESTHKLVESLSGTSALYSLSRVELENLVSQVVHEEGFAKLLEDLDSMWRVKGFLNR